MELNPEANRPAKKTALERLLDSKDMINEVFSYLPGCVIVHKIAMLSSRVRDILIKRKD